MVGHEQERRRNRNCDEHQLHVNARCDVTHSDYCERGRHERDHIPDQVIHDDIDVVLQAVDRIRRSFHIVIGKRELLQV